MVNHRPAGLPWVRYCPYQFAKFEFAQELPIRTQCLDSSNWSNLPRSNETFTPLLMVTFSCSLPSLPAEGRKRRVVSRFTAMKHWLRSTRSDPLAQIQWLRSNWLTSTGSDLLAQIYWLRSTGSDLLAQIHSHGALHWLSTGSFYCSFPPVLEHNIWKVSLYFRKSQRYIS